MQDPGYGLTRISLLGGWVNKGWREDRCPPSSLDLLHEELAPVLAGKGP